MRVVCERVGREGEGKAEVADCHRPLTAQTSSLGCSDRAEMYSGGIDPALLANGDPLAPTPPLIEDREQSPGADTPERDESEVRPSEHTMAYCVAD